MTITRHPSEAPLVGPDIASVAAALADRTRATMVDALVGGQAIPASQLASIARVSRPTASGHLGRLVEHGIVTVERCGRHAYYRLAGPDVLAVLEAMAVVAPVRRPTSLRGSRALDAMCEGRTCYDHLAGRLGVAVTDGLIRGGLVRTSDAPSGAGLTRTVMELDGETWNRVRPLGLDCGPWQGQRRPAVRACVDWSERRHHMAGSVAAAIAARLFELGWIERRQGRVVQVTPAGRDGLREDLGVVLDGAPKTPAPAVSPLATIDPVAAGIDPVVAGIDATAGIEPGATEAAIGPQETVPRP
jgi:DNA-binding transcriptional ArsR family regulator